jgi:hypothetical protein
MPTEGRGAATSCGALGCLAAGFPGLNASLALIDGAKVQGKSECAVVIEMACTHVAAMVELKGLGGPTAETEMLRRSRRRQLGCCAHRAPRVSRTKCGHVTNRNQLVNRRWQKPPLLNVPATKGLAHAAR